MTGTGGLFYDRCGAEWMVRIGPAEGKPILFLPPLFEEMNRTRAFVASLMRRLAGRGFGCWLPDLPGAGESERALETVEWSDWLEAARDAAAHVAEAAGSTPLVASVRGGALLDAAAGGDRWRFAPVEGTSLARDLIRANLHTRDELDTEVVELAGYRISDRLLAELRNAETSSGAIRTVRLESDRADADLKVPGPALWRRSEPGTAAELADLLAADLAECRDRCAAS